MSNPLLEIYQKFAGLDESGCPKPKAKRGRSSIEWLGVFVFAFAQTVPWIWVLAAFLAGMGVMAVNYEMLPLWRVQW